MKISPLILLSAIACLAFSSNAYSTAITVQNYSFESPTQADGSGLSAPTTNWTAANVTGANGSAGEYNPQNAQFTNATDSSGTLGSITPIGGDQRQVLYINAASITNGGAASNSAMQILTGVTLQASSVYTLTVAVGNEVANPDTYKISLYVGGTLIGGNYTGGTLLASTSGSSNVITAHQLADITATYTSPSSGLISGNLAIMLTNTHASQSTVVGQETFDNVRLDVAAVPEPSSVALLCIGGIGFLSWKARRRMRLNR